MYRIAARLPCKLSDCTSLSQALLRAKLSIPNVQWWLQWHHHQESRDSTTTLSSWRRGPCTPADPLAKTAAKKTLCKILRNLDSGASGAWVLVASSPAWFTLPCPLQVLTLWLSYRHEVWQVPKGSWPLGSRISAWEQLATDCIKSSRVPFPVCYHLHGKSKVLSKSAAD